MKTLSNYSLAGNRNSVSVTHGQLAGVRCSSLSLSLSVSLRSCSTGQTGFRPPRTQAPWWRRRCQAVSRCTMWYSGAVTGAHSPSEVIKSCAVYTVGQHVQGHTPECVPSGAGAHLWIYIYIYIYVSNIPGLQRKTSSSSLFMIETLKTGDWIHMQPKTSSTRVDVVNLINFLYISHFPLLHIFIFFLSFFLTLVVINYLFVPTIRFYLHKDLLTLNPAIKHKTEKHKDIIHS